MTGCKDAREVGLNWPEACLGCGTDKDLKRYDTTIKLRKHPAIGEFCDGASFYLCLPCTKKATKEQRSLRARGVVTLVIVLSMSAMFTIVISLNTDNNIRILQMLANLAFLALVTSQVRSIWLFTKREVVHSYYNFGGPLPYPAPQLSFRNEIYAKLFRSANPKQQSNHINSLRIAKRPANLLMSSEFIDSLNQSAFVAIVIMSIVGAFNVFTALAVLFWLLLANAAVRGYARFHMGHFISS